MRTNNENSNQQKLKFSHRPFKNYKLDIQNTKSLLMMFFSFLELKSKFYRYFIAYIFEQTENFGGIAALSITSFI